MKRFFFGASLLVLMALFAQTSCYYDNEAEQYGVTVCDTVSISYNTHIKPIIEANCQSCHIAGGQQSSSPFDTYNNLKLYTLNREIVRRINGDGVALMPPSGSISSCDKLIIEAWVNAGAPNN